MPELGIGEVLVWLLTTAVVIGIPVAVLVFVFRLGQRSASGPADGRHAKQ